jgi:integrase
VDWSDSQLDSSNCSRPDWNFTHIATRIVLLGFASAMRRSELAALTLTDVEFRPA